MSLSGRTVLIVEDEYLIATDLAYALEGADAIILGPAPTAAAARALIERTRPDAAVLDIALHGETVFDLADDLQSLGIPFLFATGIGPATVPPEFSHVLRCEKPVPTEKIVQALERVHDQRLSDRSPDLHENATKSRPELE
ncbi:response regulator [Novosphingobium sp. PC22D]|uniref:response regulator n=1 Tax=Novosphingobium sp. PC22D TaxID=1962403 RepID=UPI000BF03684|nr:response regulator [Novosphingobium sp. PC22D]